MLHMNDQSLEQLISWGSASLPNSSCLDKPSIKVKSCFFNGDMPQTTKHKTNITLKVQFSNPHSSQSTFLIGFGALSKSPCV